MTKAGYPLRVGETLFTAEFESDIGVLRLVASEAGLAYLELPCANGRGFFGWRQRNAPAARVVEGYAPNQAAIEQLTEYLAGKRCEFALPLDLRATPFQQAVLAEVGRIPYGEQATYGEIAARIGRPRAARAVGAANGANPLPLVVPCHRVIASSGHLQGYAGGLETKARLLALESSAPREGELF